LRAAIASRTRLFAFRSGIGQYRRQSGAQNKQQKRIGIMASSRITAWRNALRAAFACAASFLSRCLCFALRRGRGIRKQRISASAARA